MENGKGPCDNCGGEHYSPDFPHPRDQTKVKKAKEERTAYRGGGGRGGGCGGGRHGNHKKWRNYKKDGDGNYYKNGVQKRFNAQMWYLRHKECGWNDTHTYVFHAAWKHDPVTFSFSTDHDYCKFSGKTVGVATGTGDSEGNGVGTQSQRCLDIFEVISRYQGEESDATFYYFLTDFSKVLDHLK